MVWNPFNWEISRFLKIGRSGNTKSGFSNAQRSHLTYKFPLQKLLRYGNFDSGCGYYSFWKLAIPKNFPLNVERSMGLISGNLKESQGTRSNSCPSPNTKTWMIKPNIVNNNFAWFAFKNSTNILKSISIYKYTIQQFCVTYDQAIPNQTLW